MRSLGRGSVAKVSSLRRKRPSPCPADPPSYARSVGGLLDLVSPELENSPPCSLKSQPLHPIAEAVATELRLPKGSIGPRQGISAGGAAVPETAVDEDGQPLTREHNIWPDTVDSQVRSVSAEARPPQLGAQREFRRRVSAPVRKHYRTGREGGRGGIPRVGRAKPFDGTSLGSRTP